jgi:hypothetical protein
MTLPRDTIVANDSILDTFKHSRDYDYAQGLVPDHETNYFDRFWDTLEDLFDLDVAIMDIPIIIWWFLGTLAVMAVCFLIWRNRVGFFGSRDVNLKAQDITEDDINEVDLDQLIAEAENKGDHLTLCRLRYLQTLKAASDASLVSWRRYKTPTQYAQEWQDSDFGVMTNHFLRIRYGHYTADAALAQEMRSLQQAVQACIANSNDQQEPSDSQQEGGEQS